MTEGDRLMSPKIICFGSFNTQISQILAGIQLRDSIVAHAKLLNAPKHFQPRVPGTSTDETANWSQHRLRFGVVVRLHSVVRQGIPSSCFLC